MGLGDLFSSLKGPYSDRRVMLSPAADPCYDLADVAGSVIPAHRGGGNYKGSRADPAISLY